jgi:hypothetical protein
MKFAIARLAALGALLALGAACSTPAPPPKTTLTGGAPHPHAHAHNPGDHNHARGKMLLASDGKYNALLTAHLSSKDGNELDIFVEDARGPKALTASTLEAAAIVGEGGARRGLTFSCAPPNERPAAEADGTCSHYVAKAPWMKPGERLRVETALPVDGTQTAMVWRDFEPRTYAHHED